MRGACPLALAALFAASPAAAQDEDSSLAGTAEERRLWQLVDQRLYVDARELAERLLRAAPASYAAHYALGAVQHYAEGNLPRSLFHFERARELFEARWGATPGPETPWRWHAETLIEASWTAQDMERPRDQLRFLDAHDRAYDPDYTAQHTWPYMKLDEFEQARAWAQRAIAGADDWQRKVARTSLCAVEYEAGTREASYAACLAAAQALPDGAGDGGVELSNAALGALQLLRFDEAERLLRESTERSVEDYANPWAGLVGLYARQARLGEAVEALRAAQEYRMRRPAYLGQLDEAELEALVALLLVLGGRAEEALPLATRAIERPDREGGQSGEKWQAMAGATLMHSVIAREAAEMAFERASWAPFAEAVTAWAEGLERSWASWRSARRAAALLAEDEDRLLQTVSVGRPGGAQLAEPLFGELPGALGAGVIREVVRRARAAETFAPARAYHDAIEAEAALEAGDAAEALRVAERALVGLPPADVIVRARVQAVAGAAALDLDQPRVALAHLAAAMARDPGVVRRLGLALPAEARTDGSSIAERAAELALGSPRFEEGEGFGLRATADALCLVDPSGGELACGELDPRARGEEARARSMVVALHRAAFGGRVDLTQADLRSLDGSTTSGGGRSARRLQSVIDSILPPRGGPPAPPRPAP